MLNHVGPGPTVLHARVKFGAQAHLLQPFMRSYLEVLETRRQCIAVLPHRLAHTAHVDLVMVPCTAGPSDTCRRKMYVQIECLLDALAQQYPWSEPGLVSLFDRSQAPGPLVADVAVTYRRFDEWTNQALTEDAVATSDILPLSPLAIGWLQRSGFEVKDAAPHVLAPVLARRERAMEPAGCFRDAADGASLLPNLEHKVRQFCGAIELGPRSVEERRVAKALSDLAVRRGSLAAGRLWLRLVGFSALEADYLLAYTLCLLLRAHSERGIA